MAHVRYSTLYRSFLAFFASCLTATIGTFILVAWTANRMVDWDSQLMASAKDIRLEATTARLCFEEIIHGEYPADMNLVWTHFNEADHNAEQLLAQAIAAKLAYVLIEPDFAPSANSAYE